MSSNTFTLLVAHGSRDERWKRPFQGLIQRIKTQRPEALVDLCYMEMTTPTAEDVLATLDVSHLTHLQILPLFMAAGAHVAHEIEEMKLSIAQRFPHLLVEVLPPIGEHPLVQDAFQEIILKTVESSTNVVLPCSSSLREEARRRETPAIDEHPESLTPTLSLRERESNT